MGFWGLFFGGLRDLGFRGFRVFWALGFQGLGFRMTLDGGNAQIRAAIAGILSPI